MADRQLRAKAARDRVVALEGGLDDLADVELRAADPAPHYDRGELEAALAHLPEPLRTSLLLADLWGFDHDEVATALDERAAPIEAPCFLAAVSTLGGTLGDRRCQDAVAVAVTSGSHGFPTSSRNGTPRGTGPCCLQTSPPRSPAVLAPFGVARSCRRPVVVTQSTEHGQRPDRPDGAGSDAFTRDRNPLADRPRPRRRPTALPYEA